MDPTEPLLTESVDLLLGAVTQWLDSGVDAGTTTRQRVRAETSGRSAGTEVDAHAFHHVKGAR
jgi:hypothetical protein